jgi:hypothetical protein
MSEVYAEARDGKVIVWKVDGQVRQEVARLEPQEALDASSLIRLKANDAFSQTLPPGVR